MRDVIRSREHEADRGGIRDANGRQSVEGEALRRLHLAAPEQT
jgi:hypothetical protein